MDERTGKTSKEKRLTIQLPPLKLIIPSLVVIGAILSIPWLGETTWRQSLYSNQESQIPHPAGTLSSPVLVDRVIDGDTIELSSGTHVRYIGIDTPEMRRKIGGIGPMTWTKKGGTV